MQYIELDLLTPHPALGHLSPPSQQEIEQAESYGVLEPLQVRTIKNTHQPTRYHILKGARWWVAAGLAGLSSVPVVVCDSLSEAQITALMKKQNASSNPILQAQLLQAQLDRHPEWNQSDLARAVGKNRSTVAHLLRLLTLDLSVQELVSEGRLSCGQVRPLVSVSLGKQRQLADKILRQGMSVREVEELVAAQRPAGGRVKKSATKTKAQRAVPSGVPKEKSPDELALESQLSDLLGCAVSLEDGALRIDYCHNLDVLDHVLTRLGWSPE